MVGAQRVLLSKAHSTDPGTEIPVMVTINFIGIMTLTGNMGGLRNYLQKLFSKGTKKKGSWQIAIY